VYTAGGRIAAQIAPDGARTDHEYDAAGRLVLVRQPQVTDPATGAPARPEWRFEYDAGSRLTAVVDPRGGRRELEYDSAAGTVTTRMPDGAESVDRLDRLGRRLEHTDAEGSTRTFAYLADTGRLVSVTLSAPAPGVPPPSWTFAHDEAGNVVSRTDPLGRVTRFEYDELGRLIREVRPGGKGRSYEYDAGGRLVAFEGFDGRRTLHEHDLGDRLVRKILPDGTETVFTYTPGGRPASELDERGVTSFEYDGAGRLVRHVQPGAGAVEYRYDAVGRLASVASPSALIAHAHDPLNRLVGVETPEGSTTYEYDLAGNLVRTRFPNGVEAQLSHNPRNQLQSLTYRNGAATLGAFTYTYTPAGRRASVTELAATTSFAYDRTGRLIGETRTGEGAYTRLHEYDAAGNRTRSVADGVETIYTYDADDRLLVAGGSTFTYDDDGNLTSRNDAGQVTHFTWTPDQRLATVERGGELAAYRYDASGMRVEKRTAQGTVRHLVDSLSVTGLPQVLEERSGNGALLARHAFGRGPISTTTGGGARFFHADGQSSTRLLTDAQGQPASSYVFDASGELVATSGADQAGYLYSSQAFDPESDLYYLRARYYDPGTGRFLGLDPLGGVPEAPYSFNPYLYALGDPANFADPTGQSPLLSAVISIAMQGILRGIDKVKKISQLCKATAFQKVATLILAARGLAAQASSRVGLDDLFSAGTSIEIGTVAGVEGSAIPGSFSPPVLAVPLVLFKFEHPWASIGNLTDSQRDIVRGQVKELTLTLTFKGLTSREYELKGTEFGSGASGSVKLTLDMATGKVSGFEGGGEVEYKIADVEVCGVPGGTAKVYGAPALGVSGFNFSPSAELGVKFDVPFLPEIKRALLKLPDDLR
jgi:RHS repeat-associated protein